MKTKTCNAHHWLLSNGVSPITGVCKNCGAKREFHPEVPAMEMSQPSMRGTTLVQPKAKINNLSAWRW